MNINLLNYETHVSTENFVNSMSSYFFHPQIIQPTRITDHTATLIDNIFINSIDNHVPLKKLTRKEVKFSYKPWITPALKLSIQEKNKLFKKHLNSNSTYHTYKYKIYRNKLSKLLIVSKKMYYHDYFKENFSNLKKIWTGIREIVNINKKNTQGIPTKLIKDNIEVSDTKQMADVLNKYFSTIGINTANSTASNSNPLEYMNYSFQESLFLSPVTTYEIELEISRINVSITTGPFSIPSSLLKSLHSCLAKPLELLYNCSFSTGTVRDKFKIAQVIPVFKNGSQTCVNNYRPISLLSVFNRILEKLMYERLIKYVENKKILF